MMRMNDKQYYQYFPLIGASIRTPKEIERSLTLGFTFIKFLVIGFIKAVGGLLIGYWWIQLLYYEEALQDSMCICQTAKSYFTQ